MPDSQQVSAEKAEFDLSNDKKSAGNSIKVNCVSMFDIPQDQ